ncbi:MAG: hypothetical protein JJT89_11815 [Nitriliruptoraceae bacterium]|nr:hypothetical protein [Nitriliruptoraceae bacterium]
MSDWVSTDVVAAATRQFAVGLEEIVGDVRVADRFDGDGVRSVGAP